MKLIMVVLAVLLTACGGAEPEDDSMEAEQEIAAEMASAPDSAPMVVRMHGDSTQRGINQQGVNGATVAQTILTNMGLNFQVIGEGIGSTRTEQRLFGGETGNHQYVLAPWPEVLATEPAQIVTFKYGINDTKYYPAAVFRTNTEALIALSEAAGVSVILETPSPTDFPDPVIQAGIVRNVAVLKRIAISHPSVTLCNHWDYGMKFGYRNVDGIHPTPHAYEKWIGPKVASCILRAARKRAATRSPGL